MILCPNTNKSTNDYTYLGFHSFLDNHTLWKELRLEPNLAECSSKCHIVNRDRVE